MCRWRQSLGETQAILFGSDEAITVIYLDVYLDMAEVEVLNQKGTCNET